MKYRIIAILTAAAAVVVLWLALTHQPAPGAHVHARTGASPRLEEAPQVQTESTSVNNAGTSDASAAAAIRSGPVPSPARPRALAFAVPPGSPEVSGVSPVVALENMRSVFRQYASRYGGNPVGTNPEITAVLNGANPQQIVFLNSDDGLRVDERGQLLDNWGTPYFFHQISGTEMEIHSAGPDRKMWTQDDLVIK
jgi:hypothetical protein